MKYKKFIKRNVQDSFFLSIMRQKKYLLNVIRSLLPDQKIEAKDVKIDLIEYAIAGGIYNDISVSVKDQYIVFMEAQSTWNNNMPLRLLMYIAEYYQKYVKEHDLDIYSGKAVEIPMPRFYVVYTGAEKPKRNKITFQDIYPECTSLNLEAEILSLRNTEGVLAEYIALSLNYKSRYNDLRNKQVSVEEARKTAVVETIEKFSKGFTISPYIKKNKKEVIDMLDIMYDQEYVFKTALRNARREGKAKAEKKAEKEIAAANKRASEAEKKLENHNNEIALIMLNNTKENISLETISKCTGISIEELEQMKKQN